MSYAVHMGYARPLPMAGYRVRLAAWLPALQLAYTLLLWPVMTYDPTFTELDMAVPTTPHETMLNKLVPPLIGLVAIAVFLAERPRVPRAMRMHVALLMGFWGLAAASYVWSIQPEKVMTEIIRFTFIYASIACACLVARSTEMILKPVAIVFAATVAINLAALPVLPGTPIGHGGIYAHKNMLGFAAGAAFVFMICRLDRRSWRRSAFSLLVAAGAMLLLVASLSKTAVVLAALAPLAAGALLVVRRLFRISFPVGMALCAILALCLFALAGAATGLSIADISMLIGGEPTFTGRTYLWDFMVTQFAERPLLGHGFNSFWQIGADSPALHMPGFVGRATHGHNGYLDMAVHLGLAGLALYALMLVSTAANIERILPREPRTGLLMAGLLMFLCLRELQESDVFTALAPSAIVFALLLFLPLADKNRERPHVR